MSFETKSRIELAIVVIGGLALFSLPIFLMGSGL
jgi:hypothetical protein